jgi:hypothetical protein
MMATKSFWTAWSGMFDIEIGMLLQVVCAKSTWG